MKYFFSLCLLVFLSGVIVSGAKGQKNAYTAVVDPDGVQRVEILAGEYFFNPDHITVKVNVPVELKARKEAGIVPHRLVISAPDAGIDVAESLDKEPKTISFTPKQAGRYPFYCDKKLIFSKSHREKGMEGVLEVVE